MKATDTQIVKWYLKGYEDESFGTSSTISEIPILNKAYDLGVSHVLPNREYHALKTAEAILKELK